MSSTPSNFPPQSERPDWEQLARHISGECEGAEQQRITAWLAANPADHKVLEALNGLLAQVSIPAPAGLDVEAALLKTKAGPRGQVRPISVTPRPNLPWTAPWFRAAALLTIAAIGGLVWRTTAGLAPSRVTAPTVASWRAGVGKTDSVTLDDGSQVVLAPQSELETLAGFGRDHREVRLKGQGWFRAVHDDAKPFVVHTARAVIRDVGTVFSVTEKGDGRVRVAVHEGSVMLRAAEQAPESGVLLRQGDAAMVGEGQVASTSRGTLTADDADWVSGRLHFQNVPLKEIAETLQQWFGLALSITDPALAARKVTIDVSGASLATAPQELALAAGGELIRRGDALFIQNAGGR